MEDGWRMTGGWLEDGWRMAGGWLEDDWRMAGGWLEDGWRMAGGWLGDGWRMDGGWMEDDWGMAGVLVNCITFGRAWKNFRTSFAQLLEDVWKRMDVFRISRVRAVHNLWRTFA